MSGKPNNKWMQTMIEKLGSREAVSEWMAERGSKGGKNGHTGGFAADRELAVSAGRKGGTISRRGKSKKVSNEN